jgi:hypothetical protein
MTSLRCLFRRPESVRHQILARNAGEVRNLGQMLDWNILPLRNRRRLQVQVLRQFELHSAIGFEIFDQLFHDAYIQSNRNSVKRKHSVRRYGVKK